MTWRDLATPTSGAGLILSLVAGGIARSRADLVTATGFSRTTVVQHLTQLLGAGLLDETPEPKRQGGGRPSAMLRLAPDAATVLVADIGETHARLAIVDLSPALLAECVIPITLADGPGAVLAQLARCWLALLDQSRRAVADVLGMGIGLPAPVDHAGGRVVGPSVMPGWDDFDICGCLSTFIPAPVLVENDVNLMTLAEFRTYWPEAGQFLFVKAGNGIGSGLMTDGRLYRGAQGAAGDIGHMQIDRRGGPLCRCGKHGCLEAHAAGWAVARDLRSTGLALNSARDVIGSFEAGQAETTARLEAAGVALGDGIAHAVSLFNPSTIVIGGTLADAGETLLSGIRTQLHARSLPLAIRHLGIHRAHGGRDAGLLGAARLVIETRLSPAHVDTTIAAHTKAARRSVAGLKERRLKLV
ncbi:ROK family transcriptional regulator [Acidisoma silvae]|uniref:ROK family transcriptional regulator n=1 Tax=Acidisoma silvae TaxID=2802396 RepID=A0A963YWP9_9PROT|nr:ROK family transcriptional regulator [Acidisoma silvae]MCB8877538.1 ROK family transcriptional regulator [Acidisoma silvae]